MDRLPPLVRQALLWPILFTCWLAAFAASSHEIRPALAEIDFTGDGAFAIDFTLNAEALLTGIGPEHEDTDDSPDADLYDRLRALPAAELAQRFEEFAPQFLAGLDLSAGQTPVAVGFETIEVPAVGDIDLPRDSIVRVTGQAPEAAESVAFAWAPEFGAVVFRTKLDERGEGYSAYLQDGDASDPVPLSGGASQSAMEVFVDYIGVGFEHIVPLGLDHILFVIGLFLLSTQLRPLLIQISAFTVAQWHRRRVAGPLPRLPPVVGVTAPGATA